GYQSSPYSALSAFALNPVYGRLQDFPELKDDSAFANQLQKRLLEKAAEMNQPVRINYAEIRRFKLEILQEVYSHHAAAIKADPDLQAWIASSPWIIPYSVYSVLKEQNEQKSWLHWQTMQDPCKESIQERWSHPDLIDNHHFYAWMQYRLETQLTEVSRLAAAKGVFLKGDLPILMNDDSADVWAHRSLFIRRLRAGAPPDMFSASGQNWDFPIYDWDSMANADFSWWKARLQQADKFYHAYRIDHVLGFFRIWSISEHNRAGSLGYFFPSAFIAREELLQHGLNPDRIRWLAEPHIKGEQIRQAFGDLAPKLISAVFEQIENQDLYVFPHAIHGDTFFDTLSITQEHKDIFKSWFQDRALIEVEDDIFAATWHFRECSRYSMLSENEKSNFERLIDNHYGRSEAIWAEHGRRLLSVLRENTNMLTCAEDLGAVPECVPQVLSELKILGLRIPRWTREWNLPGEPYIDLQDYPALSVCALSVHDTSTTKEWWEQEQGASDFWYSLGFKEPFPGQFTDSVAMRVYEALLKTAANACMFQVQDLLVLDPSVPPAKPGEDRINVPGTVADSNWSYRMPVAVEDLGERPALCNRIKTLTAGRAKRTL
ncbi:MAG: 4-alpha-glucanotransferase, partial [Spirochaetaceae bacterium]